jgi:hypothetical protein
MIRQCVHLEKTYVPPNEFGGAQNNVAQIGCCAQCHKT